eukprot:3804484-Amphidinium_carterae.1
MSVDTTVSLRNDAEHSTQALGTAIAEACTQHHPVRIYIYNRSGYTPTTGQDIHLDSTRVHEYIYIH